MQHQPDKQSAPSLVTNDSDFRRVPELPIAILDDLVES